MRQVPATLFVLITAVVLVGGTAVAADKGLDTFVEKRCYTCHTIAAKSADVDKAKAAFMKAQGVESSGDEEKDKRGGDLSDVGKKRTAAWLKTFLKNQGVPVRI